MKVTLGPGRFPKTKEITSIRPLVPDDLQQVMNPRDKRPAAERFRDSHHRIARLFAIGLRVGDVQQRSGYSFTRISMLHNDPAFQELIERYRGLVDQSFKDTADDFFEIATSNMLKAERQIADKLDEADENNSTLPTRELIAISRDAADRFGYGKKLTNLNVNVDFAAQLEKAIKRSGKTIEGQATGVPPPGAASQSEGTRLAMPQPLPRQIGYPSSEPLRRRA